MPRPPVGTDPGAADVLGQLTEIIRLVTDRPDSQPRAQDRFVDDLRIDSLSMVEILEACSQRLATRIEDEDAKDFVRVGDLVDYLTERRERRGRR